MQATTSRVVITRAEIERRRMLQRKFPGKFTVVRKVMAEELTMLRDLNQYLSAWPR